MSLEIFQQICLEFWQNSSQESNWRTIYFQSKWRLSFDAIFAFIPRIGHSKNIALALLHYCGSQYYRSLTWNVVVISAFFDCLQFDEISSFSNVRHQNFLPSDQFDEISFFELLSGIRTVWTAINLTRFLFLNFCPASERFALFSNFCQASELFAVL